MVCWTGCSINSINVRRLRLVYETKTEPSSKWIQLDSNLFIYLLTYLLTYLHAPLNCQHTLSISYIVGDAITWLQSKVLYSHYKFLTLTSFTCSTRRQITALLCPIADRTGTTYVEGSTRDDHTHTDTQAPDESMTNDSSSFITWSIRLLSRTLSFVLQHDHCSVAESGSKCVVCIVCRMTITLWISLSIHLSIRNLIERKAKTPQHWRMMADSFIVKQWTSVQKGVWYGADT